MHVCRERSTLALYPYSNAMHVHAHPHVHEHTQVLALVGRHEKAIEAL